jgi:hypothetical protein
MASREPQEMPRRGPCHVGFQGYVWLDLWVGGDIATRAELLACEASITGKRLVIHNPAAKYAVAEGPILNGTCAPQCGDAIASLADKPDDNGTAE